MNGGGDRECKVLSVNEWSLLLLSEAVYSSEGVINIKIPKTNWDCQVIPSVKKLLECAWRDFSLRPHERVASILSLSYPTVY